MTRFPGIKTVIFDLDMTLVDHPTPFVETFEQLLREYADRLAPKTPEEFSNIFWAKALMNWQAMLAGELGAEEAQLHTFDETLRELHLDPHLARPMIERGDVLHADSAQLFDDSLEVLERLRGAEIKLGIITNGFGSTQRAKIERCNLEAYVDAVVISGEAGLHKPDAAVFNLALERLSAEPGEAIFVGDNPVDDIEGAHNAGMQAVLVDPQERQDPDLADARIHRLSELLPLLGLA
jgi:putative hydrolase of the HAD superfamily